MIPIKMLILVTIGGAIGSAARYASSVIAMHWFGADFPWGTLFVNIAGCFLMGVLSGAAIYRNMVGPELRLFLATGILGGFTTFSAFALDTAFLADKSPQTSAVYVVASVAGSLAALYLGLTLTKIGL